MPHALSVFQLFPVLLLTCALLMSACRPAPTASNDANQYPPDSQLSGQPVTEPAAQPATRPPVQHMTPADPSDAAAVVQTPITILALGDSLTEGLGVAEADSYPAQLQAALQQAGYVNAKVVNSGLSGETSTGLAARVDWALKTQPDITILTIGANDAMRGIDVATIEHNIRQSITQLQDSGSTVILGGMQIYDNMGDAYVQAFSDMYPRIVKDMQVAYIPFFLDGVAGEAGLNQADRIHPTAAGYSYIVEHNILPILEPVLHQTVAGKQLSNTKSNN